MPLTSIFGNEDAKWFADRGFRVVDYPTAEALVGGLALILAVVIVFGIYWACTNCVSDEPIDPGAEFQPGCLDLDGCCDEHCHSKNKCCSKWVCCDTPELTPEDMFNLTKKKTKVWYKKERKNNKTPTPTVDQLINAMQIKRTNLQKYYDSGTTPNYSCVTKMKLSACYRNFFYDGKLIFIAAAIVQFVLAMEGYGPFGDNRSFQVSVNMINELKVNWGSAPIEEFALANLSAPDIAGDGTYGTAQCPPGWERWGEDIQGRMLTNRVAKSRTVRVDVWRNAGFCIKRAVGYSALALGQSNLTRAEFYARNATTPAVQPLVHINAKVHSIGGDGAVNDTISIVTTKLGSVTPTPASDANDAGGAARPIVNIRLFSRYVDPESGLDNITQPCQQPFMGQIKRKGAWKKRLRFQERCIRNNQIALDRSSSSRTLNLPGANRTIDLTALSLSKKWNKQEIGDSNVITLDNVPGTTLVAWDRQDLEHWKDGSRVLCNAGTNVKAHKANPWLCAEEANGYNFLAQHANGPGNSRLQLHWYFGFEVERDWSAECPITREELIASVNELTRMSKADFNKFVAGNVIFGLAMYSAYYILLMLRKGERMVDIVGDHAMEKELLGEAIEARVTLCSTIPYILVFVYMLQTLFASERVYEEEKLAIFSINGTANKCTTDEGLVAALGHISDRLVTEQVHFTSAIVLIGSAASTVYAIYNGFREWRSCCTCDDDGDESVKGNADDVAFDAAWEEMNRANADVMAKYDADNDGKLSVEEWNVWISDQPVDLQEDYLEQSCSV